MEASGQTHPVLQMIRISTYLDIIPAIMFDPLSPGFTLFQPLILLLPLIEERDDREEIALQVKRSSK